MAALASTPTATDPLTPATDVVDGVTPENGGGREEGDVELALFRRIRSISNISGRLTRASRSSSAGYRRYFQHPLSMFSSDRPQDSADLDAQPSVADASRNHSAGDDANSTSTEGAEPGSANLDQAIKRVVSTGVAWRDALVQACATMLGTTLSQLQHDYNAIVTTSAASTNAFATHSAMFEPIPRDLADYVIITTLKQQDALSMQNATSWLFNMMDRTGAGYVLRDEFIRYAPFIAPVADFAVAGIVFDELVREQVRLAVDDLTHQSDNHANQKARPSDPRKNQAEPDPPFPASAGMRQRHSVPGHSPVKDTAPNLGNSQPNQHDDTAINGRRLATHESLETSTSEVPSRELYPPSVALRFDLWRQFFLAVQDKYHYLDEDWVRVKREVGIDPDETLIKSQGALDHSDLFPTLGKLYLSQRYLIFFAAVGRNHYVARLGAVAEVTNSAIPIMMRDCIRITLESEAKAAMDGVSAMVNNHEERKDKNDNAKDKKNGKANVNIRNETQSQYIGKLMRNFMAGRKPLLFSLLEFRETKRRDNWVNVVREMVAAHHLHVQLGFGSNGRSLRGLQQRASVDGKTPEQLQMDMSSDEELEGNKERSQTQSLNYTRSPFRNEPSPPLLAVAAYANVVRHRALRRVTHKRVSNALLVFSRAERNAGLVSWYTDSVRAYQSQSGRTWIERALAAIRENMDTNDRMYRVKDDEPFDVGKLGDAIGRFAELCAPLVRVIQMFDHLVQWRNPPATILAILVCMTIAFNGLVHYVPAGLVLLQALWVVETKYNRLGLGMGGSASEDAEQRQRNVLQLVAQVHDTLAAAQNVLSRLNRELGKVQALFLWNSHHERDSWVAVGALGMATMVLLMVPAQSLFLFLVFFLFFKHFLPPNNAGLKFWQTIPSRIEVRGKRKSGGDRADGRRNRRALLRSCGRDSDMSTSGSSGTVGNSGGAGNSGASLDISTSGIEFASQ